MSADAKAASVTRQKVRVGLIGAGRVGALHADVISQQPGSILGMVHDTDPSAGTALADRHGAVFAHDVRQILDDRSIDAVVIASRTDTHADLITRCVLAGKPVLCEKPIDLDLARVAGCHAAISGSPHHVQIGFNRRFDSNFIALRDALREGEVGRIESMHVISRVPAPPPYRYMRESGGLFRDMTIHDFDLVRFLLEREPTTVSAQGAALIDPGLAAEGDIDSAMVMLGYADGVCVHIANSRRCAYGFDHRIEVFGERGSISLQNGATSPFSRSDRSGTSRQPVLKDSPIFGYRASFVAQWQAFVESLSTGKVCGARFVDGWKALALAQAAMDARAQQRVVDPSGYMAAAA